MAHRLVYPRLLSSVNLSGCHDGIVNLQSNVCWVVQWVIDHKRNRNCLVLLHVYTFHGASDDWSFVSLFNTDECKVKMVTLQFRTLHGCGQINFQAMRSVRLRWNIKSLLTVVDLSFFLVYLLAVQNNVYGLLDVADRSVNERYNTFVCSNAVEAGRYHKVDHRHFVNIASRTSLCIVYSKSNLGYVLPNVLSYVYSVCITRAQGYSLTLRTCNIDRARTTNLRKVILILVIRQILKLKSLCTPSGRILARCG